MLYGSTQKPSQVHLLSLAPSIGSWSLGHTHRPGEISLLLGVCSGGRWEIHSPMMHL